ncbi:NADH oxidoreductase [Deinococcus marmoris]|uniref:NADH oxidoreductase n=2 Tax=Deinococcus marmoris TaxID=249408 RepID=A0A1U7NRJ1_9DEIO|nr:NADH oxidoreductase [Deinococcus marmoris]
MQALELSSYDGLDALKLTEKPVPSPAPGQVLVRVESAAVNPSDLEFMQGSYGFRRPLPTTAGFEGSGVVVAGNGADAERLMGQRVSCVVQSKGDGTWAEYVALDAKFCLPLQEAVNFDQGAMLFINPFTAWGLVEQAQNGQHRAVVQTAAASAVGTMVQTLATSAGIPVINIVRRGEQVKMLQENGAEHVLNSEAADFEDQLRQRCETLGATMAFDAVGGELSGRLLAAMPEHSTVLVYGVLGGQSVTVSPSDLVYRDGHVSGFYLTTYRRNLSSAELALRTDQIQRRVATDLQTKVSARIGLEDAVEAIKKQQEHASDGKIIIAPGKHN